jgi:hypothetical protein
VRGVFDNADTKSPNALIYEASRTEPTIVDQNLNPSSRPDASDITVKYTVTQKSAMQKSTICSENLAVK